MKREKLIRQLERDLKKLEEYYKEHSSELSSGHLDCLLEEIQRKEQLIKIQKNKLKNSK